MAGWQGVAGCQAIYGDSAFCSWLLGVHPHLASRTRLPSPGGSSCYAGGDTKHRTPTFLGTGQATGSPANHQKIIVLLACWVKSER